MFFKGDLLRMKILPRYIREYVIKHDTFRILISRTNLTESRRFFVVSVSGVVCVDVWIVKLSAAISSPVVWGGSMAGYVRGFCFRNPPFVGAGFAQKRIVYQFTHQTLSICLLWPLGKRRSYVTVAYFFSQMGGEKPPTKSSCLCFFSKISGTPTTNIIGPEIGWWFQVRNLLFAVVDWDVHGS